MSDLPPEPVAPAPEAPSEDATPAPPGDPAIPVTRGDRILTLDLMRGFAVLGILLVNIWAYGLAFPAALNPNLVGLGSAADRAVYALVFMVALNKTMPIFSMLFGAGIVLFAQRKEDRGHKPAGFFVRRQLWLLVFGLIHAYLLWNGDILVPYAMIGLILYRLRKRRPRTLLILAILAMIVPQVGLQFGAGFMENMRTQALEAEAAQAVGDTLTAEQERALDMWNQQGPTWTPTAADLEELKEITQGNYPGIVAHYAPETALSHLFMYPLIIGWNIAAYMLLGMMLFKTGVLTGERNARFYTRMALIFYGLGLPAALVIMGLYDTRFEFLFMMRYGFPLAGFTGLLVALGHIALVALAFKQGWFAGLQRRLKAAGRMAFSNYILQTLICTTVFFGYGLGLHGELNRPVLLGMVILIWILQLWLSPWWLRRYRFGPLEWVWRSLTYRSRQPFRIDPPLA
jgi:uncharacterized protein